MTRKTHGSGGWRRVVCTVAVSAAMLGTLSPEGWAMLAPAGEKYDRAADTRKVQSALESRVVRERLASFGLTDKEIESRMSRLSDRQVHQLAANINAISPGGDVGIVGLLLIVLILIILL